MSDRWFLRVVRKVLGASPEILLLSFFSPKEYPANLFNLNKNPTIIGITYLVLVRDFAWITETEQLKIVLFF